MVQQPLGCLHNPDLRAPGFISLEKHLEDAPGPVPGCLAASSTPGMAPCSPLAIKTSPGWVHGPQLQWYLMACTPLWAPQRARHSQSCPSFSCLNGQQLIFLHKALSDSA